MFVTDDCIEMALNAMFLDESDGYTYRVRDLICVRDGQFEIDVMRAALTAALASMWRPMEPGSFYMCPICHGIGNVTRETFDTYNTNLAPVWRPIAEAPKDAFELILGYPDDVGVGFWHDGSECYGHRGGEGWFSSEDRNNLLTASNFPATHFMPLPAPPVQQKEGV